MAYKKRKKKTHAGLKALIAIIAVIAIIFGGSYVAKDYLADYLPPEVVKILNTLFGDKNTVPDYVDLASIPEYTDKAYVQLNGNKPFFTEADYTTTAYENYSELDSLGRCGVVMACLGKETMPAEGEERESISNVTPSGWEGNNNRYDSDLVSGGCILTGNVTRFAHCKRKFEEFNQLEVGRGLNFVIPERSRFSTAIGAAVIGMQWGDK